MTPQSKRNGLFLVIDGLRHDTMADARARARLFPTLSRLIDDGYLTKVTANAQATQFVMPALFSQTYPLDFGGYNRGITERPASYVEALKHAGYRTGLFSACNQLGLGLGYERGFDRLCTALDYRLLIDHRISRYLAYYIDGLKEGERNEAEVLGLIQSELIGLLQSVIDYFGSEDKSAWPVKMVRKNARVVSGAQAEIDIILSDPKAILEKFSRIPSSLYWRFLGQVRVGGLRFFMRRSIESVRWRSAKWISRRRFPPVLFLSHIEAVAPEILGPAERFVRNQSTGEPWHIHIHLMDVHDARAINRPFNFFRRMTYLPKWMSCRAKGLTRRHWIYDTALMYLDRKLKRLVDTLERTGQLDSTAIVVTGDHGDRFAQSRRKRSANVAIRTFREDIEVPLVVRAPWRTMPIGKNDLLDSMSVSATLLDCLEVPRHDSFLGRSIFEPAFPR